MHVPLLDLKLQYAALQADLETAVLKVMRETRYILGPEVNELEAALVKYTGAKHAIACSSGSDALLLALLALDIGAGDEVITTPFTFFATAGAIARLGARPVFVDIDPLTFNIDVKGLKSKVSSRTKAILPVHLYGQCADMDAILKFGLPVVEDAAQAIGARYAGRGIGLTADHADSADQLGCATVSDRALNSTEGLKAKVSDLRSPNSNLQSSPTPSNWRSAGTMGAIGTFSFFPTKNLGGAGDGGALTTNDDQLAARLRALRVHGSERRYYHDEVGINGRLDTLQAAVLLVKFRHLDAWTAARRRNADRYTQRFQDLGIASCISCPQGTAVRSQRSEVSGQKSSCDFPGLPSESTSLQSQVASLKSSASYFHVYNQYTIRTARRDALREYLTSAGIGSEVYYPVPLHLQKCFTNLGHKRGDFPEAERAAAEVVSLPIFPELTADQIDYVAEKVAEFFNRG